MSADPLVLSVFINVMDDLVGTDRAILLRVRLLVFGQWMDILLMAMIVCSLGRFCRSSVWTLDGSGGPVGRLRGRLRLVVRLKAGVVVVEELWTASVVFRR